MIDTIRYIFNLLFFKRFCALQRIIFPALKSIPVLLFVTLLSIALLEQVVIYFVGLVPGKYYKILSEKDISGFKYHTLYAVTLIVIIAFIVGTKKYISAVFYVKSREFITKHVHRLYFRDVLYYQVNILERTIDNPDQRITQDVDKLCYQFSQIVAVLLLSPFTISYYVYKTWITTGYIGPLMVFIFFLISTVINKFLMSPVVRLVHQQQQMEGNFRFQHMQIRSNCESAAFYRAGRIEHSKANLKLNSLIKTQEKLIFREYILQFSIGLADYLGSILSYVILAIPIFSGKYDHLTSSELAELISVNAFVTIYLISCFTKLIDMAVQVADIAGTTHRVGHLIEKLEAFDNNIMLDYPEKIDISYGNTAAQNSTVQKSVTSLGTMSPAYVLEHVSYGPPNSDQLLVKDLSLQIDSGINILVTGDSGCGKSSFLRVLDALWPIFSGNIEKKICHGHAGVIYLPQKPFLTDGSLRQQILFPCDERDCSVQDHEILQWLKDVGLYTFFTERIGSLDIPMQWNWYDMLSPGEMQRLSFLRLFYHKPPFAILDEATSQISKEMEYILYTKCKEMNITLVSVGHRDSLKQFHHKQLRIIGDGSWTFSDIIPNANYNQSDC